ncbi:probable DNA-directed RNA polymerase, chain K (rpok) [Thermoplasma acidophilum]|uniref:DNA-directed RNA polymerase subunit Rpo6 n=1 Tax=Thermoplasma acidophilum (strain ATCC 25905 / DSM 1728 / JCM 9062 / NBRC 15155 / AMRC-C165) TaxID=273075 RepID=RPO6_THEAC|nr:MULTISPECIES: DNA-directed RNA polymerase subunit K [Thermoplasma]Q9HJ14.1 RecName: Full=DNA-directed RNA polymerase subunit Rpo6; AltName: Full=DNA-directed RNA polymerase subunit K [Thermoplasma acidophilum DSM 1728]KAA8922263.1 MAG: DNA-directed RNA polymerase subunit K [Thermoplasma sp.]MCY0851891.1 DNA-directed RNA polymerase subunit K [Thermoplasma acidophilum]CAC12285.1 probable DNA-directed RNA polymerase, chain K (rpok) [Thermoplasma acidophilum]
MKYTKFEKARIIGARALQIAMGAPVIIDVPKNIIDPVDIAMLEFENNVIPITIKKASKILN